MPACFKGLTGSVTCVHTWVRANVGVREIRGRGRGMSLGVQATGFSNSTRGRTSAHLFHVQIQVSHRILVGGAIDRIDASALVAGAGLGGVRRPRALPGPTAWGPHLGQDLQEILLERASPSCQLPPAWLCVGCGASFWFYNTNTCLIHWATSQLHMKVACLSDGHHGILLNSFITN
jgi:hypothetical protein